MASRRVAVIGAGPAGLSMADQLVAIPRQVCTPPFRVTLFDRRAAFGGVWTYDADPGECVLRFDATGRAHALWAHGKDGDDDAKFRVPGPMYDGLRTNLPCDIMSYRSHPFDPETPLFPDRATVEQYIVDFAATLDPAIDIRLSTAVKAVRRISHHPQPEARIGQGSQWSVTSIDLESGHEHSEVYDHVVLASGRCNTPTIPFVRGLWNFTGTVRHSAWWRSPIPFAGKTVVVVGNSSSGSDIARELVGHILRTLPEGESATKDYIHLCNSHPPVKVLHSYESYDDPPPLDYDPRSPDAPAWAKRINVVPRIREITPSDRGGKIIFQDASEVDGVDAIIFATGYAYDFPYLDHDSAPFDTHPLIPPTSKVAEVDTGRGVYVPPNRTGSCLTNLDDWSLFYAPDASICVLGAPVRIVPMPLTHVQSRIVAAAWSGLLPPHPNSALPPLDPRLPSTDPQKWSSSPPSQQHVAAEPRTTANLGYPSDTAYQNALLALLPPHLTPHGKDEETHVPQESQSQADTPLRPVPARDEGWHSMPAFRNQRRQDTKRLRRLLLGY